MLQVRIWIGVLGDVFLGEKVLNLLELSRLLPCQGPCRSLRGPAPYIQLTRMTLKPNNAPVAGYQRAHTCVIAWSAQPSFPLHSWGPGETLGC